MDGRATGQRTLLSRHARQLVLFFFSSMGPLLGDMSRAPSEKLRSPSAALTLRMGAPAAVDASCLAS